jgi:hypothetical protein
VPDVSILTYGDADEMHIRFGTNYGATWTADDTFTDNAPVSGFPVANAGMAVIVHMPNGNLLIIYSDGPGNKKITSSDGGKTWSAPAAITISGLTAEENDITFAIDQAIVVGSEIYVTCIHNSSPQKEFLIKSTDNGATWTYLSQIGGIDAGEAGITYIGDNTFCAIVRGTDDALYHSFSTNLGATWTAPELIGAATGGRPHLWTRAQLKGEANWWLDPVLIMCGFINSNGGRSNVLWISENAGGDWSTPYVLEAAIPSGGGYGGYGDVIWNPTTSKYIAVMHYGSGAAKTDIKQYAVTIDGI